MKFGGTFQLYKMTMAMRQLLDRLAVTGENDGDNEELLLKAGDKMDDQVQACMGYALELEAQVRAREEAMERMAKANERDLKKAAFLRNFVLRAIQFAELSLPRNYTEFGIDLHRNKPIVDIVDEKLLPADYLRQPPTPKTPPPAPDKVKILADLKDGVIIPGARIAPTTFKIVIS